MGWLRTRNFLAVELAVAVAVALGGGPGCGGHGSGGSGPGGAGSSGPSPSPSPATGPPALVDVARTYAPAFYQDLASRHGGRADLPLRIDFDGTLATADSWESLDAAAAAAAAGGAGSGVDWGAYVYWAAVETDTHWFVSYWLYHPQDWNNAYFGGCGPGSDCHENDLEGVLVVVERDLADAASPGRLLLMETIAHDQFFQYVSDPRVGPGTETIDGPVLPVAGARGPRVYVEAKGHGIVAGDAGLTAGAYLGEPGKDFPGGDGVVLRYRGRAEDAFDPALGIDPRDPSAGDARRTVGYDLLAIETHLWPHRSGPFGPGSPLDAPGRFAGARFALPDPLGLVFDGDTHSPDRARPPWAQDDPDDGAVRRGDWFFDPAFAVSQHLTIAAPFSLVYTRNAYLGIP